jgi:hypothetical protein
MKTKSEKTNAPARAVCLYFSCAFAAARKNSKRQAPSTREIPTCKLQTEITPRKLKFEVWNFSGCWMLDGGASHFSHA